MVENFCAARDLERQARALIDEQCIGTMNRPTLTSTRPPGAASASLAIPLRLERAYPRALLTSQTCS
jgi:hypothetical protein